MNAKGGGRLKFVHESLLICAAQNGEDDGMKTDPDQF